MDVNFWLVSFSHEILFACILPIVCTFFLLLCRWMNKLGLAAITYDASGVRTTAGFYRPDSPPHQVLLNSEFTPP